MNLSIVCVAAATFLNGIGFAIPPRPDISWTAYQSAGGLVSGQKARP